MIFFYLIIYIAVFLAAAGQLMLKFGSGLEGRTLLDMRLNIWVILGLGALVMSMLLNVRGLSVVPLRDMVFILPTNYVLVPLFSKVFLKERVSKKTIIGSMIVGLGVVLFNIPIVRLF